ncbi:MAG TPA: tetratricopeptide repeat protein [Tepidisphaeraceae bacterium]|nr:tetratricopeptide repeat protein [Tepidisphaeraceae bacterium]
MNSGPVERNLMLARDQMKSGRLPELEQTCRAILSQHPEHPQAMQLLGVALAGQGRFDDAIEILAEAVRQRPAAPQAHYNLAKTLADCGRGDEAIDAYRRAIQLRPAYVQAHTNLAIALHGQGRLDEAIAEYRLAVSLQENSPEAHYNLANALKDAGLVDEAIAEYRQALQLRPRYAQAHANLGSALFLKGEIDEAKAHAEAAIDIDPAFAEAHNLLGNLAKETGQLDEALAHYRRAFSARPEPWALGNYLYMLHFHPDFDALRIREEHRRYNERFAAPLASRIHPHASDRSAQRTSASSTRLSSTLRLRPEGSSSKSVEPRLRVGYVSPHFRRHPAGRFLLPLLENHDHGAFEIFCYSGDWRRDEITERLQRASDGWRCTVGVSDEELARLIREDRIDILVDLTMHMENSRLLVFARKPAPVQVTYLAYCSTTGVETIDYRLTDPYLDPANVAQPPSAVSERSSETFPPSAEHTGGPLCHNFYSEESVHLPRTYWCFEPPADAPAVADLPASANGHITFGCLNNFAKVTAPTLAAWAEILGRVPGSKLLLHCPPGGHRQRVLADLADRGVNANRVEFVARIAFQDYLRLHNRIDIALDPFPYAGGTTTCDALWMGVPVVSLAGQTAVSRAGLSLLSNVGLSELAAPTREEYVRLAASLARDLPRLSELRRTLRQRMRRSPLMNAPQFARDVETEYRMMWAKWCEPAR